MTKKIISFILGRGKNNNHRKEKEIVLIKKDKKTLEKEREISQIISTRFGRALERLGER
jgi:hypothetical protein